MTDNEEFGKIRIISGVLYLPDSDSLGLKESKGAERPAGPAARLVLDGSYRIGNLSNKLIIRQIERL